MKPATLIATIFLGIVSIAQFTRFAFQVEVVAGGKVIPVWLSAIAFAFTGGLAIWLWLENRRK